MPYAKLTLISLPKTFKSRNFAKSGNTAVNQCDQMGLFLQVLGNKLSCKSSPNMMVTFGLLGYSLGILGEIRQLFNQ